MIIDGLVYRDNSATEVRGHILVHMDSRVSRNLGAIVALSRVSGDPDSRLYCMMFEVSSLTRPLSSRLRGGRLIRSRNICSS